jgi:hypothetical protein
MAVNHQEHQVSSYSHQNARLTVIGRCCAHSNSRLIQIYYRRIAIPSGALVGQFKLSRHSIRWPDTGKLPLELFKTSLVIGIMAAALQ